MTKLFRKFRTAALGFLLLSPATTGGDFTGKCPCLTIDEATHDVTFLDNIDGNTTETYGIGCRRHDAGDDGLQCSEGQDWCEREWCYVDPRNCEVAHTPDPYVQGAYYSYAACGYADEFIYDPDRLKNKVLRAVFVDNHRGYKGTICDNDDNASCHGTVVDLAEDLFFNNEQYNFTVELTTVPDWVLQRAKSYRPFLENDEDMEHGACVYATSIGIVDLCLGAFTKNRQRAGLSTFLELGVTSEYLVVRRGRPKRDIRKTIANIFRPFAWSLWVCNFFVLIVLSLLFTAQTIKWPKLKQLPLDQSVGLAVYDAILGFFAQDVKTEDDPLTWAGRFTLLAIAVQILLSGAAYTANLTSYLVRESLSTDISSIEDAKEQNAKVCVLRNKISILDTAYGKGFINYALGADELPGFGNRADLLAGMNDGLCRCAVIGQAELDSYHGRGENCDKHLVSTPVIELPWGIPVSQRVALPLETLLTRYMQTGAWNKINRDAKPSNICNNLELDTDNMSLKPQDMLGAYVASGLFVAIGVFFNFFNVGKKNGTKIYRKSRFNKSRDKAKPNSESSPDLENDTKVIRKVEGASKPVSRVRYGSRSPPRGGRIDQSGRRVAETSIRIAPRINGEADRDIPAIFDSLRAEIADLIDQKQNDLTKSSVSLKGQQR